MQEELEINSIADLYKNLNVIFCQTKILVELILTYPITSNEGVRSFSQLKRLLTSLRTSMKEERICNLARMAMHPARLNALNNDDIIDLFADAKPRRLALNRICDDNDSDEFEGSICWSFFTLLCFYLCTLYKLFQYFLQEYSICVNFITVFL